MTTQQQPILQPEQPGHGSWIQDVSGLFAEVVEEEEVVVVVEGKMVELVAAMFWFDNLSRGGIFLDGGVGGSWLVLPPDLSWGMQLSYWE